MCSTLPSVSIVYMCWLCAPLFYLKGVGLYSLRQLLGGWGFEDLWCCGCNTTSVYSSLLACCRSCFTAGSGVFVLHVIRHWTGSNSLCRSFQAVQDCRYQLHMLYADIVLLSSWQTLPFHLLLYFLDRWCDIQREQFSCQSKEHILQVCREYGRSEGIPILVLWGKGSKSSCFTLEIDPVRIHQR